MTVLYILTAVILLIAVALNLYIKLYFKFDSESAKLILKIGPVKLTLLPKKEKRTDYKRLAKKLKGKKLSEMKPMKSKKKKNTAKITDVSLESVINDLSEHSKNPELTRIALCAVKEFVFNFKNKLHTNIAEFYVQVSAKDAAATCIQTELIRQAATYFIEFVNCNTSLSQIKDGAVQVVPVFDDSGYKLFFKCDVKVKIIHLVSTFLKAAFKSIVK